MAAPTTPTLGEMTGWDDNALYAELLKQARRVEDAISGSATAPTSPTPSEIASQGKSAALAHIVYQFRRIEDAI